MGGSGAPPANRVGRRMLTAPMVLGDAAGAVGLQVWLLWRGRIFIGPVSIDTATRLGSCLDRRWTGLWAGLTLGLADRYV